jgi:NAD(P)H-hydrate epimerase
VLRALLAAEATLIDVELMASPGFSIDQLMELAGLSCAEAIHTTAALARVGRRRTALIFAGPGNNGGDGLVAARHLHHFGWSPTVVYPKRPQCALFTNLVAQLESLSIPVLDVFGGDADAAAASFDVVVDAIFGFGFRDDRGPVRAPFDRDLALLAALSRRPTAASTADAAAPLVASIDVPSGWRVDGGDGAAADRTKVLPQLLISLTAPKQCALVEHDFDYHFLGGRFVPPPLAAKYRLDLGATPFPGAAQSVRIARADGGGGYVLHGDIVKDVRGSESNCEQDSRKM